jgi:transcriptional regulator with XRE-family HTH domain
MTFAERLHQLRDAKSLSREQLAEASGLSRGVIRDYEQGKRKPTLESAFKLAKALGVDCTAFNVEESGQTSKRSRSRSQKGK